MASFDIDGDLIRKLAELLQETGLTEIEFAEGEQRIRVTRATSVQVAAAAAPAAVAAPAPAAAPSGPPAGAVTSPMVGTAYLAPEPSAPAFVKVGDTVKEGQTVMIVEAMKVMNPIRAPQAGTVTAVMVKDAQPVEYGEVLLVIE
ncbi:MAG TPA: acetyl-CoA carboxylase biotin carboxyl carrier protein [Alphaproteobacteria bacterium]|nr:acetyl-CoA carboxylase biotin carboxyl carrier protein [Alphaproteobacteria bacterium]